MKKILLLLALQITCNSWAIDSVNAVLGDTSYLKKFGEFPTSETSEIDRIKTHLEYVEDLLRGESEVLLTEEKLKSRMMVLDYLHDYSQMQRYPKLPMDFGSRQPCFIDDNRILCAVAYLVTRTEGRGVAEAINSIHRFEYLLDMNDPALDNWAEKYGFSLRELAMIQPTYGYLDPPQPDPVLNTVPELNNEDRLRMQLQTLQAKYANLSHENEQKKIKIEEQNGIIAEKDAVITDEKARNEALQTQMVEERETLNGEIKKKKKWNIALGGVATTLTTITIFQWIRIRNAE